MIEQPPANQIVRLLRKLSAAAGQPKAEFEVERATAAQKAAARPQEEVLDLVLSEVALSEARKLAIVSPGALTVNYINVAAITIGLGGICTLFCNQAFSHVLAEHVTWAGLIVSATAMLVVFWSLAHRTRYPTNIILSQAGVHFAWRDKNEQESELIPWTSIIGVLVKNAPSGKAQDIILRIRFADRRKYLSLEYDTCSLWAGYTPCGIGRIHSRDLKLRIPLDALVLEADRQRLTSGLDKHLPPSAKAESFQELLSAGKNITYTQLWLDDMNSFRRKRLNTLEEGTLLQEGRYEIKGRIATGGQAKIYRAMDHQSGTLVVLKELVLPTHAGAEVRTKAFDNVRDEALLHASLDHPGIVKLLDKFVEDHRAYLVLEYVEGQSLRAAVQTDGPMSEGTVVQLSMQICRILAYLHGLSPPVVHRDLAPDNLMLNKAGAIQLLDFNVAQRLESARTKTVVGKHNYMSPEQFRGKPSTRSDLYSLGCTLYFLLTGCDPEPLTSSAPNAKAAVSEPLNNIVKKLTQTDESNRYQSTQELLADLEALANGHQATH
jgi:tRNA A-37 threonylcarbamoyl transferase component Bud32